MNIFVSTERKTAAWLVLAALATVTACEAPPSRSVSPQDGGTSQDVATVPDLRPAEVMVETMDSTGPDLVVASDAFFDVGVNPLIEVELAAFVAGRSPTISPALRLSTFDQIIVRPAALTLRYWYTVDSPSSAVTQSYDWGGILGLTDDGVAVSIVPVVPPRPMADFYAELHFLPGAGDYFTGPYEFLFNLSKSDMSSYDQSNDYSYNGMIPPNGQHTERVTGYLNGTLIYGKEP